MKKEVFKVKVGNNLKESIEKSVNRFGGFGRILNKGDRVLLKPNFNTADPFPASTDISFLKEVISLIYEAGASKVIVGGSSTLSRSSRKEISSLGVFDLEKEKDPPMVVVFEEGKWIKKKIPGGKYLKTVTTPEILEKTERLIFLPCLKTHKYAQFTGSLKLSVGFMKPRERISLHLKHLQEKIADLNRIINPDLIIMDARKCFISGGPSSGELREPGIILTSKDRAGIDIEGVKIIQSYKGNSLEGKNPYDIPQISSFKENHSN